MFAIKEFGTTKKGERACLFTYTADSGMQFSVTDFGASIVSILVPNKDNVMTDVVLGYDKVSDYEEQENCMGAIIGRTCNRLENASFTIDEKRYELSRNNGKHHIHGGFSGFQKKIWKYKGLLNGIEFSYMSVDGEEGYPGNLTVTVRYTIENGNKLKLEYFAKTDKDTICNLTNHAYFNLQGYDSGDVLNHYVQIDADYYTEVDELSLPNGKINSVDNTVLDFRKHKKIGDGIHSNYYQIAPYKGYDINYVIKGYEKGTQPKAIANVYCKESGITMEVQTTMPGVQFYTGNYLEGSCKGKDESQIINHSGFCLETQYFPNAMAHNNFVQPLLRKGEKYHHITCYKFDKMSIADSMN